MELDDFLGNAIAAAQADSSDAAEPVVERLTKREKRLARRDKRNREGSKNRKGYGHTPEQQEAKRERIRQQKANIERKKRLAAI